VKKKRSFKKPISLRNRKIRKSFYKKRLTKELSVKEKEKTQKRYSMSEVKLRLETKNPKLMKSINY
jgi:hypothetical protein